MKKLVLFSALILMIGLQSAMAYINRLQVSSYDNAPIQLYIDGVSYGEYNNNQVVENLAPGYHQMQVVATYYDNNTNHDYQTTVFYGGVTVNEGYSTAMVVNPDNRVQVVDQVALYQPNYRPVVTVAFRPFVVVGGAFCGTYYREPVRYYHPAPRVVYHRVYRPYYAPRPVYHAEVHHYEQHHYDNHGGGHGNSGHYGPRR